jgi:hypothetical protein
MRNKSHANIGAIKSSTHRSLDSGLEGHVVGSQPVRRDRCRKDDPPLVKSWVAASLQESERDEEREEKPYADLEKGDVA